MALSGKEKRGPGRSGRLSAEQAADLPDRLMDAAWDLFSELGYAETSMEKIARRAGASTKTVYGRWPNKDEVLKAVVRRLIDRTLAQVNAETAIEPGQVELRAFLVNFLGTVVRTVSSRGAGIHRLAFSEAHRSPELIEFFTNSVARAAGVIRGQLEFWKAAGRLPQLGDMELTTMLLLSMIVDGPRIRAVLDMPFRPEEIGPHVETGVDLFLRGVGYQPAPAG